jgi:hypothetical protein
MAQRPAGSLPEPLLFNLVEQEGRARTIVFLCVFKLIKLLPLANIVFWWMDVVCKKTGEIGHILIGGSVPINVEVSVRSIRYVRRLCLVAYLILGLGVALRRVLRRRAEVFRQMAIHVGSSLQQDTKDERGCSRVVVGTGAGVGRRRIG